MCCKGGFCNDLFSRQVGEKVMDRLDLVVAFLVFLVGPTQTHTGLVLGSKVPVVFPSCTCLSLLQLCNNFSIHYFLSSKYPFCLKTLSLAIFASSIVLYLLLKTTFLCLPILSNNVTSYMTELLFWRKNIPLIS